MTREETIAALEASIRYREQLLRTPGNTISSCLEGDLEFYRVILQDVLGIAAIEAMLSRDEIRHVAFHEYPGGVVCNVSKFDGLGGNGVAAFEPAADPAAAAIAAQKKVEQAP